MIINTEIIDLLDELENIETKVQDDPDVDQNEPELREKAARIMVMIPIKIRERYDFEKFPAWDLMDLTCSEEKEEYEYWHNSHDSEIALLKKWVKKYERLYAYLKMFAFGEPE